MTTTTHAGQRAMRQGTRRAVDGIAAVRSAGVVQIEGPRAYCMSDADAAEAVARRKQPIPPKDAPAYKEAHLIDRMWQRGQLNDRLHDTAVRLYSLFLRAGLEPKVVGELGERRSPSAEIDDATDQARAQWTATLIAVAGRRAELLHAMCLGEHPGTSRLASLQAALSDVEPILNRGAKKDVDKGRS